MSLDTFLSTLPPEFAKKVQTAQETEVVRLPLISKGLTKDLGGGIARGRIMLLHGDTSSGKTALCLQSIAEWQKQGLVCSFIDVEGTFDKAWAERLGVDNDQLIVQTSSKSSARIEQDMTPLLKANVDVLVLDSISDIMPEVFVDDDGILKDQDDRKQIGAHAKAIAQVIKAIHYYNESTAVILISQNTTKFANTYVENVPHGGQKALFNSSQVVRLVSSASPTQQITEEVQVGGRLIKKPVARDVSYLVKKNKLGSPFGAGEWRFYYDGPFVGVDAVKEMVTFGLTYGIIHKGGAWFTYNEERFQGEKRLIARLREDVDLLEKLSAEVDREAAGEAETE